MLKITKGSSKCVNTEEIIKMLLKNYIFKKSKS